METTLNTVTTSNPASGILERFNARLRQYNVYRRTVRELSGLSDRALADLGLSRQMIRSVAREAAKQN